MSNKFPIILQEKPSFTIPMHVYASVVEKEIETQYSHLTRLPYLKESIILLPDFHGKPLLETPSSSVIITSPYFSLSLTSPSQNCGMSFLLTPLTVEDLSSALLEKLMSTIKTMLPLKHAVPVLSRDEVWQALTYGAEWGVRKFGLAQDTVNSIEYKGNLIDAEKCPVADIRQAIPEEIIELSRKRFGILGGGNHFLEIQTIDEILDHAIAKTWGLQQNQIVCMFHTGSDALGAYLGRLYASRKKTSLKHRLLFYRRKITFHLLQSPWKSFPERISYYFWPGRFRFINPDTPEGARVLWAINSAANFGFASRVAIFNAIQTAFTEVLDDQNLKIRLLYDCSHNSIYREEMNGEAVWVHRHNACRAYPPSRLNEHPAFALTGQPVILPGTNQTSSFICAAREGALATHYTVDHGLGAVQKRHEERCPLSQKNESSCLFHYEKELPEKFPLLDDTAVNDAVEILNKADIITTVARLKPLATLKGPKSKIV